MLRTTTILSVLVLAAGCQVPRMMSTPPSVAAQKQRNPHRIAEAAQSQTKLVAHTESLAREKSLAGEKLAAASTDALREDLPSSQPSIEQSPESQQGPSKIKLVGHANGSQEEPAEKSFSLAGDMRLPASTVANNAKAISFFDKAQQQDTFQTAPGEPNSTATQSPAVTGLAAAPNQSFSIDLPTSLQLAGADNWNVRLARERINQANAQYTAARTLWLPTISFGLGYNHHEGQIQSTQGDVIEVSRNSLFVGGGAGISAGPLTGGSGGPARMFIDLSVADAIFQPLYRCQLVHAARCNANAVFNQTQFQAGSAYYELSRSNANLDAAQKNLLESNQVLETIQSFVQAEKGAPADVSRIKVIVEQRKQAVSGAQAQVGIASSQLATVLQLDPCKLTPNTLLSPLDASPIPVRLVETDFDLQSAVQQAICMRPEIRQLQAQVRAAQNQSQAETWRPLLPNLHVGGSGGGFGGGQGSDLPKIDGRADLDVIVAWQLKNLGVGVNADRRQKSSLLRQARLSLAQARDIVAADVTQAYHEIVGTQQQVENAQANLGNASDAMSKTIERIRGLEGNPLELIQSLDAMKQAREDYLNAVTNFNVAQLKMLLATGSGPSSIQQ